MKLLAISFPRHDGSISYYDGKNVRYLKLERTEQKKRFHYNNRWEWIRKIKTLWNVELSEIDEIVFDFHPENEYGWLNIPPEVQSVIDGKTNVAKLTVETNPFKHYFHHDNIYFIGHHYAHSLSTWMLSDREPDVCIVIDGVGDFRTWSVFKNDRMVDKGIPENGSFGGEIMRAGDYLNITASTHNDKSGKVMGIQSYGNLDQGYLEYLQQFDYRQIREVFSREHWYEYKGNNLLGDLTPLDWIRTVHERCSQLLLDLFSDHASPTDLISYSGGVAQNVLWNTVLKEKFPNLIIPPHSSDEGLSLGGLEFLRRKNNLPRFQWNDFPYTQSDFKPNSAVQSPTIRKAAEFLAQGKTIAWYQDNGEVGPRALGNRSILMRPDIENGRKIINKIKNRENYRPFGASVLAEHAHEYFELNFEDRYMLFCANLKVSGFDAITHVDGTCRVQTVEKTSSSSLRSLLEEFYQLTGCPILLNTSLNLAGLPLAGYPEIAVDLFYTTNLDAVFVGDQWLTKS